MELKSASSSGTKSQKLPTNKTNESVMRTPTTQTSLGKCTVSPGDFGARTPI